MADYERKLSFYDKYIILLSKAKVKDKHSKDCNKDGQGNVTLKGNSSNVTLKVTLSMLRYAKTSAE